MFLLRKLLEKYSFLCECLDKIQVQKCEVVFFLFLSLSTVTKVGLMRKQRTRKRYIDYTQHHPSVSLHL